MRLVDFLVLLLHAHGETLKRLAAFFGEEEFLEMLEISESEAPKFDLTRVPFARMGSRLPAGARSPYVELEGAVREMGLPATLEFHLWAYPYYRFLIESDLDLGSLCSEGDGSLAESAMTALVEQSITEAKRWVHALPIPPSIAAPAESAAALPWIRFRTQALKKLGLRPMEPVGQAR